MAAINPAPRRQRVSVFPTPDIRDLLFYERVDTKLPQWSVAPAYGSPHPDALKYPNHRLCYIKPAGDGGELGWQDWFYAAPRSDQNNYNFEYTKADLGGTKFDAVRRTYVTLRSTFTDSTHVIGELMPNIPAGVFSGAVAGDYVLSEYSQQRIGDRELDGLFLVETLVYVKRCTSKIIRYDEETGTSLLAQSNLYFSDEVVPNGPSATSTAADVFSDPDSGYWGLNMYGVNREGRQVSCNWYEITETELVPNNPVTAITGSAATAIPIRSYFTEDDFSWPATLTSADITFKVITAKNKDGTTYTRTYPRVDFAVPAYRGPTKMKVEQWWSPTAIPEGSMPVTTKLIAREIEYTGANYSLRIDPSLHGSIAFVDTIGTSDPNFVQAAYGETFSATTPTSRPNSLIATVDQRPFRGGYRITVITAYKP